MVARLIGSATLVGGRLDVRVGPALVDRHHPLAAHGVSVARLVQQQENGSATLHVVTHEAPGGDLADALAEVAALPETKSPPGALPVVSDRGVLRLGWA